MEEVRVQEVIGSNKPVPRSVGPLVKDPQQAQDAPVEQINKQVETASKEATVISPSLQKQLSRTSAGTQVQFSASSPEDAAKGKINFIVIDKESGEVVRSFPDHGIGNVKAEVSAKPLVDAKV